MPTSTNHGRQNQRWIDKVLGVGLTTDLVGYSIAAGGSNVTEVTITVKNADADALSQETFMRVWLSDTAGGALTGTTASGTVTAKTSSGTVIETHTSKKSLDVKTLGTGVFILEITDTAKSAFYVNVVLYGMAQSQIFTSRVLATGDYG